MFHFWRQSSKHGLQGLPKPATILCGRFGLECERAVELRVLSRRILFGLFFSGVRLNHNNLFKSVGSELKRLM